tara:strand:+ start:349 stop:774 length:426 start_codon:yes stop_codon:yes gene_type:complete
MLKLKKIKNLLIEYIFLILLILIILQHQNFFKNFFEIATKNYHIRMIISHGNCDRRGYGFLKHIKDNYILESNPIIHNFAIEPNTGEAWFKDISKQQNYNNIILLNYKDKKKEINLPNKKIYLKNYKIIYQETDCLYLKKK